MHAHALPDFPSRSRSRSRFLILRLLAMCLCAQIGTTKGTGGDVLILEEAAYCDEGFFYETVAPILSVGNASLVAISTLTSEINFYTRLIKMVDPATDRPLFTTRCIELCCEKCKEDGKAHECVHMLHLVPAWQSQERHRKLKIMMQVCFYIFIYISSTSVHSRLFVCPTGPPRPHPVGAGGAGLRLAAAGVPEVRHRDHVRLASPGSHQRPDRVGGD